MTRPPRLSDQAAPPTHVYGRRRDGVWRIPLVMEVTLDDPRAFLAHVYERQHTHSERDQALVLIHLLTRSTAVRVEQWQQEATTDPQRRRVRVSVCAAGASGDTLADVATAAMTALAPRAHCPGVTRVALSLDRDRADQ